MSEQIGSDTQARMMALLEEQEARRAEQVRAGATILETVRQGLVTPDVAPVLK